MDIKTLGLFGGTFDPVHHGHLALARCLRDSFALPEVRLIPTGNAPHRAGAVLSNARRLALLQKALACKTNLIVDDRELRREGVCYTIDTLREIQAENPQTLLVWLIGGDSFLNLAKWRDWQALLEIGHLVVAARPGFDLTQLSTEIAEEYAVRAVKASPDLLGKGRISLLPTPLLPFSATEIREKLARGEDVSALTPVAAELARTDYEN